MSSPDGAGQELVSKEFTDELFGATDDCDMRELQQELWDGVSRDLLPDLEKIGRLCEAQAQEEARKLIHRVAGYAGSIGLNRCHALLKELEFGDAPLPRKIELIELARQAAIGGMAEIQRVYPHIGSSVQQSSG